MSRESRMTAGILLLLLPAAFFLSVLSRDVLPLKARRRSLPGYPAESIRGGSTAFPAGGADGTLVWEMKRQAGVLLKLLRTLRNAGY